MESVKQIPEQVRVASNATFATMVFSFITMIIAGLVLIRVMNNAH